MKFALLLIALSFVACSKESKTTNQATETVQASSQQAKADDLLKEKDESCDTAEMTEDKLVQQAMKPAKANSGGALQGATDCTVE